MPDEEVIIPPQGVIDEYDPRDFVSGDGQLAQAIATRVLLESGDYTSYAPKGEKQKQNGFETNNCTAFSYTNCIETQFNVLKSLGLIPQETLDWLQANEYLVNGELQLSDRALGAWAGTTQSGNSLSRVAHTAYSMGLVPDKKWPSVWTNYNDYYRRDTMPVELYDLGKEFLKRFFLPYERITSEPLDQALKAAPLYVALKTCSPWTRNPVPWCGIVDTNHAVELLKQNDYRIMDSYEPFVRDLANGYVIPYFYKVLLTIIDNTMTSAFFYKRSVDNGTEYGIGHPSSHPEAIISEALSSGLAVPMKPGVPDDAPAKDRIDWDKLNQISKTVSS